MLVAVRAPGPGVPGEVGGSVGWDVGPDVGTALANSTLSEPSVSTNRTETSSPKAVGMFLPT